jgi:hypothetical protein
MKHDMVKVKVKVKTAVPIRAMKAFEEMEVQI